MAAVSPAHDASRADHSQARTEQAEAEGELGAFTGDLALARRLRGADAYEAALDARLTAVETARERVEQLTRAKLGDGLGDLAEWDFDVAAWWEEASIDERKTALASAIDVVFLRGPGRGRVEPRVLILWRGQGPDDLPRRGRNNGALQPFIWAAQDELNAGVASLQRPREDA